MEDSRLVQYELKIIRTDEIYTQCITCLYNSTISENVTAAHKGAIGSV